VAKQYELGQMIGVNGTPAIVLANGKMIPGYQPAPQLAKLALEAK
jgi:thiol:disulfide interchange protein DsbC